MKAKLLCACALLASCGLTICLSEEKSKEPDVKKMMQRAHKGKTSPLAIVQDEVKRDMPNWILLEKNTKPLTELAGAIKDNETYTSRPGPYVAAIKLLSSATEKKDLEQARRAVAALDKSCAGCHRP
jgi:hypothetical protein